MNGFDHRQSAHCETGALSNLLRHHGLDLSEPMIFGLASGLTYAWLPLIRINGLPLMAYRLPPRMIIRNLARRQPDLRIRFRRYRRAEEGMADLDRRLDAGQVVGLQTSVFFLPYFPEAMRFHFNAHNLVVYGREGDEYLISDPVFDRPVRCDRASLRKARFTRGPLAPRGLLYTIEQVPESLDLARQVQRAIRFTARMNGRFNPVPFAGVRGMRRVARHIDRLEHGDRHQARLFLGHIVRMQEEIGTGGGGFRYLYAAFLQEAGERLGQTELQALGETLIAIGDAWREFALLAARIIKQRGEQSFPAVSQALRKVADRELAFYDRLGRVRIS